MSVALRVRDADARSEAWFNLRDLAVWVLEKQHTTLTDDQCGKLWRAMEVAHERVHEHDEEADSLKSCSCNVAELWRELVSALKVEGRAA